MKSVSYRKLLSPYKQTFDPKIHEDVCSITIGGLDDTAFNWDYSNIQEPIRIWDLFISIINNVQKQRNTVDTKILHKLSARFISGKSYNKKDNTILYEFDWIHCPIFHDPTCDWEQLLRQDFEKYPGSPWGKDQHIVHINNPLKLKPVTRFYIKNLAVDENYYLSKNYSVEQMQKELAPQIIHELELNINKLLQFKRKIRKVDIDTLQPHSNSKTQQNNNTHDEKNDIEDSDTVITTPQQTIFDAPNTNNKNEKTSKREQLTNTYEIIMKHMTEEEINHMLFKHNHKQIGGKHVIIEVVDPAKEYFYYLTMNYVNRFLNHYKCHTKHSKDEPCPYDLRQQQLQQLEQQLQQTETNPIIIKAQVNAKCKDICANCTNVLQSKDPKTREGAYHPTEHCKHPMKYCSYCGMNDTHGNTNDFNCPIRFNLTLAYEAGVWHRRQQSNQIKWPKINPNSSIFKSRETIMDTMMKYFINLKLNEKINLIGNNNNNNMIGNNNNNNNVQNGSSASLIDSSSMTHNHNSKKQPTSDKKSNENEKNDTNKNAPTKTVASEKNQQSKTPVQSQKSTQHITGNKRKIEAVNEDQKETSNKNENNNNNEENEDTTKEHKSKRQKIIDMSKNVPNPFGKAKTALSQFTSLIPATRPSTQRHQPPQHHPPPPPSGPPNNNNQPETNTTTTTDEDDIDIDMADPNKKQDA